MDLVCSEDRLGSVRVWMLLVAVLAVCILIQLREIGVCGDVTGIEWKGVLREMLLFFWLDVWRRDGKLPQISDSPRSEALFLLLGGQQESSTHL